MVNQEKDKGGTHAVVADPRNANVQVGCNHLSLLLTEKTLIERRLEFEMVSAADSDLYLETKLLCRSLILTSSLVTAYGYSSH